MVRTPLIEIMALLGISLLVAACAQRVEQSNGASDAQVDGTASVTEYEIVTLLPKDGIPAIYNPQILSPEEAAENYAPDELVLGVEIDGDARAYSLPFLSGHEIVNDTVGGRPIAVTW